MSAGPTARQGLARARARAAAAEDRRIEAALAWQGARAAERVARAEVRELEAALRAQTVGTVG